MTRDDVTVDVSELVERLLDSLDTTLRGNYSGDISRGVCDFFEEIGNFDVLALTVKEYGDKHGTI